MTAAVMTEILKLRRSRLWWITLVAFTVVTVVGGLFMFISQDPARARDLGLLGAKAQLGTVVPDWAGYFGLLSQIAAVAGILIFGMLTIWMFGREFADRTVKDLLALPTSRTAIVVAKFVVGTLWSLLLSGYAFVLSLPIGAVLRLPGWSAGAAGTGAVRLLVTAAMTIGLTTVLALAASVGRGYLAAVAALFVGVFCAQIIAALGYGQYFPWSVPALYSGMAGPAAGSVGPLSIAAVFAVAAVGVTATVAWWSGADQTH